MTFSAGVSSVWAKAASDCSKCRIAWATVDGQATRLFDLFRGPHWTPLAFGAAQAPTVTTINDRFGPALRAYTVVQPGETVTGPALVDSEGHIRAGYDMDDTTLVLIRPDGYVGLCTDTGGVERVAEYWTALYGAPAPGAVEVVS